MAFLLPCCAIVLCYARIFYIVRKTALRIHETQLKSNGSVRLKQDPSSVKSLKNEQFIKTTLNDYEGEIPKSNSSDRRVKKILSKSKEEDLKFIDTSVESDLPPTLSKLQRKSQNFSIEQKAILSPLIPSSAPMYDTASIMHFKFNQLNASNPINQTEVNCEEAEGSKENNAVENCATDSIERVMRFIISCEFILKLILLSCR